mmetsp:Transcript_10166/g.28741  ORF Transcript_10166/g.28741 Transcript_10166/m.28741 type:complete len:293 (-) Transcript_10166:173-1051(-)
MVKALEALVERLVHELHGEVKAHDRNLHGRDLEGQGQPQGVRREVPCSLLDELRDVLPRLGFRVLHIHLLRRTIRKLGPDVVGQNHGQTHQVDVRRLHVEVEPYRVQQRPLHHKDPVLDHLIRHRVRQKLLPRRWVFPVPRDVHLLDDLLQVPGTFLHLCGEKQASCGHLKPVLLLERVLGIKPVKVMHRRVYRVDRQVQLLSDVHNVRRPEMLQLLYRGEFQAFLVPAVSQRWLVRIKVIHLAILHLPQQTHPDANTRCTTHDARCWARARHKGKTKRLLLPSLSVPSARR